jgi:hypothetical protein
MPKLDKFPVEGGFLNRGSSIFCRANTRYYFHHGETINLGDTMVLRRQNTLAGVRSSAVDTTYT